MLPQDLRTPVAAARRHATSLPARLEAPSLAAFLAVLLMAILGACRDPSPTPGELLSFHLSFETSAGPRTPEGARLAGEVALRVSPLPGSPRRTREQLEAASRDALLLAAEQALALAPGPSLPSEQMESELRRQLAAAGLRLEHVSGRFSLPGEERRGELRPTTDSRVILIGLDGYDWDVADPLLAAGRLPVLQSLIERGTKARLASIAPLLSPVIWTSIATGREPADHGILDFLGMDAAGRTVPVTSNLRRVPAFWEVLSEAGCSVGVVAWWASWPAEPVEGFVVSDRVAYQLFGLGDRELPSAGKVFPPALWSEVEPLIVEPGQVSEAELRSFVDAAASAEGYGSQDARLLEHLRAVLASARTYTRVGLALHDRFEPRFGAYYFQAPDTAAHLFMRYADPPLPEVDPSRQRRFAPVVNRIYEYHDRILGRFLERADEKTVVMLVSDHGFKTGAERPRSSGEVESPTAADWHARFGILVAAGPGLRQGHEIVEASVLDVFPTLLALLGMPVAEELDGRVLEEALTPEFLAAQPPRSIASFERPGGRAPARFAAASEEDRAILESLVAIGYVSSSALNAGERPSGDETDAFAGNANAHNNLGTIALARGEIEPAIAEFRRAVELQAGFQLARVNLAQALLQAGRTTEAEAELMSVLEAEPGEPKALALLAELLLLSDRAAEAVPIARRAVESDPRSALGWYQLGRVHEARGHSGEARAAFERSATLDAEAPDPRNALGNLHEAAGDWAEAARWYEAAITADPRYAGAYNNLALQHQRLGRFDLALEVYQRGRKKLPGSAILLNNLASWYHQSARVERRTGAGEGWRELSVRAEALYREAMQADPLDPSPLNNLGGLLGERGDREAQRQLYERAVALDPRYADGLFNLADWQAKAGDLEAALKLLDRALAAQPGHHHALRLRGAVREELGDRPGACADYLASLALRPEQEPLATWTAQLCR